MVAPLSPLLALYNTLISPEPANAAAILARFDECGHRIQKMTARH